MPPFATAAFATAAFATAAFATADGIGDGAQHSGRPAWPPSDGWDARPSRDALQPDGRCVLLAGGTDVEQKVNGRG
jgi:hypothetical protein